VVLLSLLCHCARQALKVLLLVLLSVLVLLKVYTSCTTPGYKGIGDGTSDTKLNFERELAANATRRGAELT
jgi:hypothetical protein